jgi:hypothetical protein|tara:strand:+ start:193 stop:774 length:582 start_codon:yes stop_codon:yes gene_type:complete
MAFATIDVTKGITGTIPVANGGTGLTSGTSGQFLKFTGTTTVASSALGDVGKILQVKMLESGGSNTNINSSSYQRPISTGYYLSITPSSTSNKIYCFGGMDTNTETMGVVVNIKFCVSTDGGSNYVDIDNSQTSYQYLTGATRYEHNTNYLVGYHVPANTNAHRFSFQALSSNGTTGFYANSRASIALYEVAP